MPLSKTDLYDKEKFGFDLLEVVDCEVSKCYMDDYIVERLSRHSVKELRKLDIWDAFFLSVYHLKDPRRWVSLCTQVS